MFYYFSAASIYYAVIKSIFIVLQSRRPESDITMNQITPGCLQLRQCVLRIKIVVCALMFSVLVLSVNGPFRQGLFVPPLPSSVLFFTFVVLHYHFKLSQLFFLFPFLSLFLGATLFLRISSSFFVIPLSSLTPLLVTNCIVEAMH